VSELVVIWLAVLARSRAVSLFIDYFVWLLDWSVILIKMEHKNRLIRALSGAEVKMRSPFAS
jgi:cytochrome c oxidase subunit IV